MSKWSDRFDLDEWREEIAVAVGNGEDILEAAGRDWDGSVRSEPPQPPALDQRSDEQDQPQVTDTAQRQEASP